MEDEQKEAILSLVSRGYSLLTACSELKLDYSKWRKHWTNSEKDKADYQAARELSADFHAEQVVEIADDETIDPNSRRIRVEARKWIASKMKPKVYSDKTILSNDPENPVSLLAIRLDEAIRRRNQPIDITPAPLAIEHDDLY